MQAIGQLLRVKEQKQPFREYPAREGLMPESAESCANMFDPGL
jgi:hypothetical protein